MFKKEYVILVVLCALLTNVRATGKICKVEPVEDQLKVTIETMAGNNYIVQCRSSLVAGVWENVEEFQAAESITVKFISSGESHCYVRVVDLGVAKSTEEPPPSPPPPPAPS